MVALTRNKREDMKMKFNNFRYLLLSSSISAIMAGIFGPFYILYIQKLGGGFENFGIALGLLTISSSLSYYVIGKYSDNIGRKPFMILSSFIGALLLLSYVFISSISQLFVVQVLFGMNDSIWNISETTFLSDITKKKTRGRKIGKYQSITGVLQGIAMFVGGVLVGRMGFEIIFYLGSFITLLSAIPLFFIKE